MQAQQVQLSNLGEPIKTKIFPRGKFELFAIAGKSVGRATYEPGWKWSEHVGPQVSDTRCRVSHFGYVVSGTGAVGFDDGSVATLEQGAFFHIPAVPHDSWVIGEEAYVSLHLDHPEDFAASA